LSPTRAADLQDRRLERPACLPTASWF